MKINRYLIIFFVALTTMFVSCEEYEDSVEPSPTVADSNPAVRFLDENETYFEIPSSVTSIELTVIRSGGKTAIEVPVNVIENTESAFDVPSTLSFPAGKDTVTLSLPIKDGAPLGAEISISLSFGEDFVNPYKAEYGAYHGKVTILNWKPYANGTYQSAFFGDSWEQVLFHAENTNRYRFFDLYTKGIHFNFLWDEGKAIIPQYSTDADGAYLFTSGYVHPTYGMVTFHVDGSTDNTFYDSETGNLQIHGEWTVEAGSFGPTNEVYHITEKY